MNIESDRSAVELKLIDLCYVLNDALSICSEIEIGELYIDGKISSILSYTIGKVNELLERCGSTRADVYKSSKQVSLV